MAVSAQQTTGSIDLRVVPDRPDWTYEVGSPVGFHIVAIRDGHPLALPELAYEVGPEWFPPDDSETLPLTTEGLTVHHPGLREPGFLRLVATARFDALDLRGVATVAFSPERIVPIVTEPADFDAFWAEGLEALARVPVKAKLTPMPESSTASVDCWQVGLENVGTDLTRTSRIYGVLCEPKGEGPFPALLEVPGGGVYRYEGNVELAARGFITFQIGVHGLPVNLDASIYEELWNGGLFEYWTYNLDDRERYYFRRPYIGSIRANDFLVTRARYDGENLGVVGGSGGGALAIATAALDGRVRALAALSPALADGTAFTEGRAGGCPALYREERDQTPVKLAAAPYYDTVNFARRVKVPGIYTWGFNDEACPPTSMYAAYNVITAEKSLLLARQSGHEWSWSPDAWRRVGDWLEGRLTEP